MESGMISMVLQSLFALAFVLGLFALVVWAVRRFQIQSGGSLRQDFKIVQRIHLDNKNSIVEVSHKGDRYLLGLSAGSMIQLQPPAPDQNTSQQSDKHE